MSDGRPRSKSTFSFRSIKSDKSGKGKLDLTETDAEKRAGKMSKKTKADPNLAVNEAQPIGIAQAKMTMAPMRNTSYKDANGSQITDPDWSNPSRPRLERPLDTIRSFEAAIDNSHRRKANLARPDSSDALPNTASRRSSYHSDLPQNQRYMPGGGSGSRVGSFRQGYGDHANYRQGHGEYGNYGSNSPGYGQRRTHSQRMPNNNRMSPENGVYPYQGYQDSYDTVHTGESSGSQSTDLYGNSTDPSSENSSIDRMHPMVANKSDMDAYSGGVVGRRSPMPMQDAIQEEYGSQYEQQGYGGGYPPQSGGYPPQNGGSQSHNGGYQSHNAGSMPQQYGQRLPAPPTHTEPSVQPRPVIKLGGDSSLSSPGGKPAQFYEPPSRKEEKKGFFKKRFSKD